jgi:hypothetical protein
MIKGLQVAGQNPTRDSFITNLRNVTSRDAEGLLPDNLSFSLSQFGKAPPSECAYFPKLEGSSFVPVPADGKPVWGTLIPNSNQASG